MARPGDVQRRAPAHGGLLVASLPAARLPDFGILGFAVSFVLLTVVVAGTPTMSGGQTVMVTASTTETVWAPGEADVWVFGRIFVRYAPAEGAALEAAVAAVVRDRGAQPLVVFADRYEPYGRVPDVLDAARAAGAHDVLLLSHLPRPVPPPGEVRP